MDRTVRFERLQSELDEVASKIGLPPLTLPHAKGGHRPKGLRYTQALTPVCRERIELVCAKETRYYGYRLGAPPA